MAPSNLSPFDSGQWPRLLEDADVKGRYGVVDGVIVVREIVGRSAVWPEAPRAPEATLTPESPELLTPASTGLVFEEAFLIVFVPYALVFIGTLIFGPAGNSRWGLLFFVTSLLLWGYPVYFYKVLPVMFYQNQVLHLVFLFLNFLMWFFLYHSKNTDPGFLPLNTDEYERAVQSVAYHQDWKQTGAKNPLSRLCHTCRLVRPLRSKHCKVCNRCVKEFDHHCPYIYNCVGHQNRSHFLAFTTAVSINCLIGFYFAYDFTFNIETSWPVAFGLVFLGLFFLMTFGLSTVAFWMAAKNITTNERINYRRYEYLKDARGEFHNPFDSGVAQNLLEYFHMRRPTRDEEIHHLNLTQV